MVKIEDKIQTHENWNIPTSENNKTLQPTKKKKQTHKNQNPRTSKPTPKLLTTRTK